MGKNIIAKNIPPLAKNIPPLAKKLIIAKNITGPEKGNRKSGAKPYLCISRAPNAKRDKLFVTFS